VSAIDRILPLYGALPIPLQNLIVTGYGFVLHRRRYGAEHDAMLRFLMQSRQWSRDQLKDYEFRRLKDTVEYANRWVPYYRNLWKQIGFDPRDVRSLDDFRRLPVTEKQIVKQDPLQFVSEEFRGLRLYRGSTSGTTGKPLATYKDRGCYQRTWAFLERQRRIWGIRHRRPRISIGVRPIVPMSQTTAPFWRHDLTENNWLFSNFHLSTANLDRCVDKIAEIQPEEINGYPSGVSMLAVRVLERGVKTIRPKTVITTAETLYPGQREVMESAFGCKIADEYGSGEVVVWVAQCPHGTYHVSHEFGFIETVQGNESVHGVPGEVLGTGFVNRAQVFVRYRLGDTVMLPSQPVNCACGWQSETVDQIVGRTDDILYTPDGRALGRLDIVMKGITGVAEAQLVQDRTDHLTVNLVPDDGVVPQIEHTIRERLFKLFGPRMQFDFVWVDRIERTRAGKFRYQVNLVTNADRVGSSQLR